MDALIGGTPFNVLLEQAASLKTAQLASSRTKYDSFEVWYQHTLYSLQDVIQVRKDGDFSEMIAFASDCKQMGNSFYEKLEYNEAIHQYERALSVFKWIEPVDPDWRNKGIDDETQRECIYQCTSEPEEQLVNQLNLSCLLNLSICYLKSNEFRSCISACNAILNLNPNNAKAYYRRAQAKLIPQSAGMVEYQEALKDLQMASSLQPNNASIKKEYLELKQSLKQQVEKDKKTFNNLFDRVDYSAVDDTSTILSGTSGSTHATPSHPASSLTYSEVLTSLKDLESAALSYDRDGNKQAAAETRRRITAIQGLLQQAKREQQEKEAGRAAAAAVDYSEPTEKMIEDAAAQGIDLRDERVRKLMVEMERLRVQQLQQSSTTSTSSTTTTTGEGSTGSGSVDPKKLYQEALKGIHLEESKQLAEKVLEGLTREQLVDMMVCRSTFTFHANNKSSSSSSSSGGNDDGGASVDAVIKSVSNVIGAYSPDQLYAELHALIVQDVMQVKSGAEEAEEEVKDDKKTSDGILSLLEERYFSNSGSSSTSNGRAVKHKTWLRSPLAIGVLFGIAFLLISIFLKSR